jgi:hypothetical protein
MGSFSKISTTIKLEWSYFLLVLLFALYACPGSNKSDAVSLKNDPLLASQNTEIIYGFKRRNIDSILFSTTKKLFPKTAEISGISDFKTVVKKLMNWVEFDSNQAVLKINFSNGKTYNFQEGDYCSFIAYYPSEDILLCEGGHTSDVSFNLSTGETTDLTGNPQYIVSDSKNEYRLNAYFGGQECYTYFIQKKINGVFTKVIDLQANFPELCIIEDAFWSNDRNLFIKAMVGGDVNGNPSIQYYQLSIIEK